MRRVEDKDGWAMQRMWEVIQLMADGWRYCDIAERIGWKSEGVVKRAARIYYQRTGTDNARHLVAYGFRKGFRKGLIT